jgi:peptide/nickel transport system substrate-binding protein
MMQSRTHGPRARASAALAAVVAGVLLASACSSSSAGPAGTGAGTGTDATKSAPLLLQGGSPTQGFDPAVAQTYASTNVMALFYGTLVQLDSSNHVVPDLAASWTTSADGLTYTIKLRKTDFSDGTPVTAADVVFSIKRMQGGAKLKGALAVVTQVTATDSSTVTLTLSKPFPDLMTELATAGSAGILKQSAVTGSSGYFTKPTATSGPFELSSYVPNVSITFKPNPGFWQPSKLPEISMSLAESTTTGTAAALQTGALDIGTVDYGDASELAKTGTVQLLHQDALNPVFFGWNTSKPPFNSLDVRKAFAYADNRAQAEASCWFNTGAVTYGSLLRPWDPNYVAIDTYKSASQQAADATASSLLNAAGWKMGPNGVRVASGVPGVANGTPFKVTVPYENGWPQAGCHTQVLQASMQAVGVQITPESYDEASFYQEVAKGAFDMYHGGAGAIDAYDLYLNWFDSKGGLTDLTTHLDSPSIDALVNRAESAPSAAAAKPIFQQLEQWQAANLPILVDSYQFILWGVSNKVHGYRLSSDPAYSIQNVTVSS